MVGKMGEMQMERNVETRGNCRHLCLFCYSHLPKGYLKVTTLENKVPFGDKLVIQLDNPSRNVEAFELLCMLLRVDWRRSSSNNSSFDERKSLPLCSRCQNVYQELLQLHVQIKELEKQLNNRAGFIRGLIEVTEKGAELGSETASQSQLALLGLDLFRKKVVGESSSEINESAAVTKKIPVPGPSPPSTATIKADRHSRTENIPPPPCPDSAPITVKEEVYAVQELEENFCLEDNVSWMGNGNEESSSNTKDTYPSADENSLDAGNAFGEDGPFSNEDSGSEFEEKKVQSKTTIQTRRSTRNSAKSKSNDYILNGSSGSENEKDEDEQDYIIENDSISSNSDVGDGDTSDDEFELPKSHKKSPTKSPPIKRRRVVTGYNSNSSLESECHICSTKIIGQKTIAYHYSKEHPTHKKYSCTFCSKHYKKLRECLTHQRNKHTGEKPFQCSACPSAFASKKLLKCHTQQIHTDRSNITIPCSKCSEYFSTRTLLTNHLASVHGHQYKKKVRQSKSKNPPRTWKCHICSEAITGYTLFIQHYTENHPDEKRYTCKFCQKYFNRYRECARHQLLHTGERPLKCDICDKSYRDNKALLHHQRHVHREGPITYHVCPTCGKQYTNTGALHYHMYSHSEALIFCKLCGNAFKNPASFNRHNRKAHKGKAECSEPIDNPTKEILQSLGVPEQELRIKCHLCWSPFLTRILLRKHFKEEHPDHKGGLNTCHCGKEFEKYKDCCRHAIRHNGTKTFQCDQCPQTFFSGTELKLHAVRHIPVEERKNHICDVCGLGLVSEYALASHKKIHEGNQPRWVCEQCGKSYSRKKGLIYHTKVEHLKITPFQCNQCGKAFAVTNDLTKHERSHSKERPFKCPLCDKCFPYTSSRRRHLREVHKVEGGEIKVQGTEEEGRGEEEIPEVENKPTLTFGGDINTLVAL